MPPSAPHTKPFEYGTIESIVWPSAAVATTSTDPKRQRYASPWPKWAPVIVTLVPPAAGPESGETRSGRAVGR